MGAAASSSSSAARPPKKYDVFISFRGEDTRNNFTSHLHAALCQKSIETYIDYRLQKGDEISPSLIEAIEDSSLSVVVFSQTYAFSKWCLDELVHILHCRKNIGQVVIPVFYKVDPSDVRKQKGSYREAFTKHERNFIYNQDKVNKWKNALFETANLAGWDSQNDRDESEFIQNIVNNVLEKLNLQHSGTLKGLTGIDENCKCIELLLEKAPIIGIWGMGGIGKTTMAKVVFAKLSSQYESCCFLENLREESEKYGMSYIRDKLLSELLKEKNPYGSTSKVVGSTFLMRRLKSKKVFIVLDDVSSSKQIEYLAQECDCLGPNSTVLITTRDKHLLSIARVNEIYEAKPLNSQASLELFHSKAFHKDHSDIGYEQLSKRVVDYAQGIPLALIILGSFLHSKTREEWESALKKFKKTPNKDIQEALKLSYDGLDYEEREMFLEIACFLKGEDKARVMTILDSYGFHAIIGLRTLLDRALIINTFGNKIWMHDLIQEVGWQIVNQESIEKPGRRSRLWDTEEVYQLLKNNQGTNTVKGITLDMSQINDIYLGANAFKKMPNLRFLKLYFSKYGRSGKVNLPSSLKSFSNKLRYLHWDSYPLESLPSTFCLQNLVEFHMEDSQVKKLWDGAQDLVNLRIINLNGSKKLMELPDFSKARNLEVMKLWDCENLCNVHPSILSLPKLYALELLYCSKLESLPSESHSKSLRRLAVSYCYNLKEFSLSSEEITELFLHNTRIEMLHPSIGRSGKLKVLTLSGSKLKNLPIIELSRLRSLEELQVEDCQLLDERNLHILFDELRSLQYLYLGKCSNLSTLPDNISNLTSLEELDLSGSSIKSLPSSINHLSNLTKMNLSSCTDLFTLPDSISNLPSLRTLGLKGSSIKSLPASNNHLSNLETINLSNCSDLSTLPDSIGNLLSLYEFLLQRTGIQNLPATIKHLSNLEMMVLSNCKRLRSLPELPPRIRHLDAKNCASLETVVTSTCIPEKNEENEVRKYVFLFPNCMKLDEHSNIADFTKFSVKGAVYSNYGSVNVCYPGSKVPEWFGYRHTTKEASMTIELAPPFDFDDLRGFVFCSVLSPLTSKEECRSYLECQCRELEVDENVKLGRQWFDWLTFTELNSDHVFLWYCPFYVKRTTCVGEKVTFEFYVSAFKECNGYVKHDGLSELIKACGVCPIYDSEYHNFVKQMLGLELGRNRKRPLDIDEEEQPPIKKFKESSIVDVVPMSELELATEFYRCLNID